MKIIYETRKVKIAFNISLFRASKRDVSDYISSDVGNQLLLYFYFSVFLFYATEIDIFLVFKYIVTKSY